MKRSKNIESVVARYTVKKTGYSYYVPSTINHQWLWTDPTVGTLLESASLSLGTLNSFARLVPNIELFIQLHVKKEAVVSSRIEGTQTTLSESLMSAEELSPEKRDDWLEVRNYSYALQDSIEQLQKLPLSWRLLCSTHRILLSGARGRNKSPGQFRSSQNWIGGASLRDAVFIPPSHEHIHSLMGDVENFLHNDEIHVPSLLRIAIAHYQFETIHPFLDGNGRIGRLMIPLYLVSRSVLDQPLLYLSTYFEQNKTLYYDNLTRVREKNDLLHWIKYFLVGIDETAKKASATLSAILQMQTRLELQLRTEAGRRTKSGLQLLTQLFRNPVVRVREVTVICDISTKAANDLVSLFVELKILRESSGLSRNRIFIFQSYLDLFE